MRALRVVEPDPVFDDRVWLGSRRDFVQIDGLLFERPPQPFDEDVVEIAAPPVHRDFDVSLGQGRDPGRARVLAALIRIHDLGLAVFGDGLFQGSQRKSWHPAYLRAARTAPCACPIHDCHQIQEAVLHGDVGDVAAPNVVRAA